MRARAHIIGWTAALGLGALGASATPAASAILSKQCLECHGTPGVRPAGEKPGGTNIYLGDWEQSVHAGLECTDCHGGITSLPHDVPLGRPDCSGCHGPEVESYRKGTHGLHVAAGDSLAPRCATCHDPHSVRPASDSTSVLHRSHLAAICTACHADPKSVGGRTFAVAHPTQSYSQGAHARAMAAGNLAAATCGDCHDSHAVLRAQDPTSPVYRQNVPATCGKCHTAEADAFAASVHGKALARGSTGAPVCNSCHGEHAVLRLGETGKSTVLASQTCESCHSNPTFARRYDLPIDAVSTYEDSYHGRAARGGLAKAAGCTSCHGVHRILAKDDPASSIAPANLVETCTGCHPGATPAFAASYAHVPTGRAQNAQAATWVRQVYFWLIALVIGGMLAHNALVWRHDLRREFRLHKDRATHLRFTRGETRQHALLLVTFLVLVVTGFALRYPGEMWAKALAAVGLDEGARRIVHRIAAVLFILVSLYHLGYLFTRRGREQLSHMAPRLDDARQAMQNVAYYLGRTSHRPNFGRFRYIEKAEYWALVWGTAVMVGTGLLLWFPETIAGPSWVVRVAEAVHLYEAWLAFLAIVVWHLFFVLLRPGIHGSFTAVTGRMDPDELAHEHPEEYARVYGPRPSRAQVQAPHRSPGAGPEVAADPAATGSAAAGERQDGVDARE